MGLTEYIEVQRKNLDTIKESPYFSQLCYVTDRLYNIGREGMLKDKPLTVTKLFMLEHKSFLSAATLIAQAQPDDAAPINRRAIEVARLAWALKADPQNAERWIALEERQKRWQERDKGRRPKGALNIQFQNVPKNENLDQLNHLFGVISDSKAHFTPEYFGVQGWDIVVNGEEGTIFHSYFEAEKWLIESAFLMLNAVHLLVLKLFDDCYDGAFKNDKGWQLLMATRSQVSTELIKQHQKDIPDRFRTISQLPE